MSAIADAVAEENMALKSLADACAEETNAYSAQVANANSSDTGGQQTVRLIIGDTDYGRIPAQIFYDSGYDFDFSSYAVQVPEQSLLDDIIKAYQSGKSWLQRPLFLGKGIDASHPEYSRIQNEIEKLRQEAQGAFIIGFPTGRVGNIVEKGASEVTNILAEESSKASLAP